MANLQSVKDEPWDTLSCMSSPERLPPPRHTILNQNRNSSDKTSQQQPSGADMVLKNRRSSKRGQPKQSPRTSIPAAKKGSKAGLNRAPEVTISLMENMSIKQHSVESLSTKSKKSQNVDCGRSIHNSNKMSNEKMTNQKQQQSCANNIWCEKKDAKMSKTSPLSNMLKKSRIQQGSSFSPTKPKFNATQTVSLIKPLSKKQHQYKQSSASRSPCPQLQQSSILDFVAVASQTMKASERTGRGKYLKFGRTS